MKTTEPTDPTAYFDALTAHLTDHAEQIAPIWLMSPTERLAAFMRGELTQEQQFAWAARKPHEVPTLNGEWLFIAATTPEACVRCDTCGDDEVALTAPGQLAAHPDHRHPYDPHNPNAPRPSCPAGSQNAASTKPAANPTVAS